MSNLSYNMGKVVDLAKKMVLLLLLPQYLPYINQRPN